MEQDEDEAKETSDKEEIHCYYCKRPLRMFSDDYEGDDMWLFMLNDGQGGDAYMCQACHDKRQ